VYALVLRQSCSLVSCKESGINVLEGSCSATSGDRANERGKVLPRFATKSVASTLHCIRTHLHHLLYPYLTSLQTSFTAFAGFSLLAVSPWSQIHADAPLADHEQVRPGKTDERSLQGAGLIAMSDVATHNRKEDCWVVIDGQVWDMTHVSTFNPIPSTVY
jgi:hypothetical protein